MDEAENSPHRNGGTWIDHFESNLRKIAIRRAPLWNQGLVEAIWVVRIDSRKPSGQRIRDTEAMDALGMGFFEALLAELFQREPTLKKI
jgi:hypothetical protein